MLVYSIQLFKNGDWYAIVNSEIKSSFIFLLNLIHFTTFKNYTFSSSYLSISPTPINAHSNEGH